MCSRAHANPAAVGGVPEDVRVDASFAVLRTARHWPKARDTPDAYVRKVLVNLSHDRRRNVFRRPREAPLPPDPDLPRTDTNLAALDLAPPAGFTHRDEPVSPKSAAKAQG
jgi:DNA-directed RNA polymerase specialized sigma24 family protein